MATATAVDDGGEMAYPGADLALPAGAWNDLQTIRKQWLQFGRRLLPASFGVATPLPPGWCWLQNTGATDVDAFGVLGIDQPLIDISSSSAERFNGIRIKGVKPSTSTPHYGKYAIPQEPIKKTDGIGRAIIAGCTLVSLNITHAEDLYCEIEDQIVATLKTGPLGSSRILWKSTGTGSSDKWGLIRLGEPSGEILVKNSTGGDYSPGDNSFDVITGTPGSESATGQTITARNFTTVKAGKKASCAILQNGHAYASPQET